MRLGRAAAFLMALALGAFALRAAWRLYQEVPAVALGRVDWRAIERRRASFAGEAGEGRILAILSNHVTRAYQRPTELPDLLRDAQAGAAQIRSTALPRLQMAALVLLAAQRDQVPPDEQWARVKPYLEGLQTASLAHQLLALQVADIGVLQKAGLQDGVAARVAELHFSDVHGPLLQSFVAELARFEVSRTAAGDAAGAALTRQVADRWLRDWILEPGPAGLRLLAADLLAQRLEQRGIQPDLVAKCRAWRTAYRTAAKAAPAPPGLFNVGEAPLPSTRLVTEPRNFVCTMWLAGALAAALVLALLGGLFWIGTRESALSPRSATVTVIVAVVVVVGSLIVIAWQPDLIYTECQRWTRIMGESAGQLGWPRLPVVAAALVTLVGPALVTLVRRRTRPAVAPQPGKHPPVQHRRASWLATLGGMATVSILVLGPLTAGAAIIARMLLFYFGLLQPREAESLLRALADPNAQGLLTALRAWTP